MRLRLTKAAVPEIVAYMDSDFMVPEYQCTCGMGVAMEYKYCPYCGAELSWDQVRKPSKEFRELLKRL